MIDAILSVLESHTFHGRTAFSVEPCSTGEYSEFYQATVCKESSASALLRYRTIASAQLAVADRLFCTGAAEGSSCKPDKRTKLWNRTSLIAMSIAVAIAESGYREDVQVGRGRSGKADDVGGQGRGPSNEACLAQIHPERLRFYGKTADDVLGLDQQSLENCFSVQMEMLLRSRSYCAWAAPKTPMAWATVALYGSGNSCDTSNHGKTAVRYNLYKSIYPALLKVSREADRAGRS